MSRNDDIIDDYLRILQPLVSLDELHRTAYELRQRFGGREYYIKVDRASLEARRQKASGFRTRQTR